MANVATSSSPLIKSPVKKRLIARIKRRFKNTIVTSKLAILCLFWLGLANYFFLLAWLCWSVVLMYHYSLRIIYAVIYLFYPCFGYLGVRYKHYPIIMIGATLLCITSIILQVTVVLFELLEEFNPIALDCIVYSCFILFYLGIGLFTVNIVPFTVDQILDSCSEEKACFTRWWVFVFSLSYAIVNLVGSFQDNKSLPDYSGTIYLYTIVCTLFVSALMFVFIGICFKPYFIIEPPPSVDPLKLIYRVLKYAWEHKYPVRRSAFTYNDNPSRLDYGKDRYGGPFTTDQVESVRSFWYILAIMVCVGFCHTSLVQLQYHDVYAHNQTEVFSPDFVDYINPNFMLAVVPPFYQLVLVPFFPNLIPKMLIRIWFGFTLVSVCFAVSAIIYKFVPQVTFAQTVTALGYLSSIGSAIVSFTSLEFILAQAHRTMQGLLIGVWAMSIGLENTFYLVSQSVFVRLTIASGVLCVLLVVYSVFVCFYKYRTLNELSDINARAIVEEIYVRNLSIENKEIISDTEDELVVSM